MKTNEMLSHIDDERVVAAIHAVESSSSGEVRVCITGRSVDDPVIEAWKAFARMKMNQTRQRNAALVFIAPKTRKFAIVGDEGLQRHCEADFWNQLAAELAVGFRKECYTEALTRVIDRIGGVLNLHFPPQRNDHDELPNEIVRE